MWSPPVCRETCFAQRNQVRTGRNAGEIVEPSPYNFKDVTKDLEPVSGTKSFKHKKCVLSLLLLRPGEITVDILPSALSCPEKLKTPCLSFQYKFKQAIQGAEAFGSKC